MSTQSPHNFTRLAIATIIAALVIAAAVLISALQREEPTLASGSTSITIQTAITGTSVSASVISEGTMGISSTAASLPQTSSQNLSAFVTCTGETTEVYAYGVSNSSGLYGPFTSTSTGGETSFSSTVNGTVITGSLITRTTDLITGTTTGYILTKYVVNTCTYVSP